MFSIIRLTQDNLVVLFTACLITPLWLRWFSRERRTSTSSCRTTPSSSIGSGKVSRFSSAARCWPAPKFWTCRNGSTGGRAPSARTRRRRWPLNSESCSNLSISLLNKNAFCFLPHRFRLDVLPFKVFSFALNCIILIVGYVALPLIA